MVSFYTPRNLQGNYLSNLKPQAQAANLQQNALNISPEQLMAIYNKDLGQSPGDTPGTGGDANQGAGEAQDPSMMSTQDIADEVGQLGAMSDVTSVGKGLGFSFGPVGLAAGGYGKARSYSLNKELEQRNRDLALQGLAPVGPSEFSFDPQMSDQEIADQNKEMQRSVSGTDQGISRNDPNPAPSGDPGEGQGSTVICTELHRQGYLSDEIYKADQEFGGTLPYEVLRGYHRWALPWVKVMRASTLATRLTWLVARPWAQHMAYQMGVGGKDSMIGRIVMNVGLPLCRLLARNTFRNHPHAV